MLQTSFMYSYINKHLKTFKTIKFKLQILMLFLPHTHLWSPDYTAAVCSCHLLLLPTWHSHHKCVVYSYFELHYSKMVTQYLIFVYLQSDMHNIGYKYLNKIFVSMTYNVCYCIYKYSYNIISLEGMAAYGRLLLAPAEGWWPLATWRALRALFSFRCLEGLLPIIFI